MVDKDLNKVLDRLIALPKETEWVEFKASNADPNAIGEYLSAIANSAALCDEEFGFIVWGIEDTTHEVVGINFDPKTQKKGAEELENWLTRLLDLRINFKLQEVIYKQKNYYFSGT